MSGKIELRSVIETDLERFFNHQQDTEAVRMAAFTSKDPTDRAAFDAHWAKIMANPEVVTRTILYDNDIAGHVAKFVMFKKPEITFWIAREHWGKGIATAALKMFLNEIAIRPLYARVAADNRGSIRVLEKCGFERIGTERGYANARGEEIDEVVMELE